MERRADSALRFAATANALAKRRSSRRAPSAIALRRCRVQESALRQSSSAWAGTQRLVNGNRVCESAAFGEALVWPKAK